MTATEQVILVDKNDIPIGVSEKIAAHRDNLCHRAFSIFIFHHHRILLQQRAATKYHTPSLWTNTCCSHPRPGESIIEAGQRRLKEEMGIETILTSQGFFHYIAHFANGLTENEVDHVLVGNIDYDVIQPNPTEVQAYRWVGLPELKQEIAENPHHFTPWLERALQFLPL